MSETMGAAVFKAKCLALLDEVAETGKEIVITKRGKRIARLVRVEDKPEKIWGRLKGTVEIHGDIFSTGEKWEADS
jgi:prevent-host-death family protein